MEDKEITSIIIGSAIKIHKKMDNKLKYTILMESNQQQKIIA